MISTWKIWYEELKHLGEDIWLAVSNMGCGVQFKIAMRCGVLLIELLFETTGTGIITEMVCRQCAKKTALTQPQWISSFNTGKEKE